MLTSLQNPLVKQIRKLHQRKGRQSQGQFLLEGTHLVQEALAVGYPLSVVCATEGWCDRNSPLVTPLAQHGQRWQLVSPEVLAAMATTINPDGVVATAPSREPSAEVPLPSLGVAVDTLQDPGNLGTLIRTAAAAAADGLWLSADSVDLEHPKVLRATAGQWFRLPLQRCADLPEQLGRWRQQGVQVLGTSVEGATPYWDVDWRLPTVLLLGNEGAGVSAAAMAAVDQRVSIPVSPTVESLNVAISAAILLYEARRQRR